MVLIFYFFALFLIISSIGVVISKNTVIAVLCLILTFCNASGLMVLIGAEFIAMTLVVVYVGAIAILFLFIVMMLDMHFSEAQANIKNNFNFYTLLLIFVIVCDLIFVILLGTKNIDSINTIHFEHNQPDIGNIYAIGNILYTEFILPFQICGVILFFAMVVAIILTFEKSNNTKKQNTMKQIAHNKNNCLVITKPNFKEGVLDVRYE